jgi:hypothetical protein
MVRPLALCNRVLRAPVWLSPHGNRYCITGRGVDYLDLARLRADDQILPVRRSLVTTAAAIQRKQDDSCHPTIRRPP